MHNENLSEIVSGAYEAAFDETRWEQWVQRITHVLGGVGGTFFVYDATDQAIKSLRTYWAKGDSTNTEYVEEWMTFDPQIPTVHNLTSSTIYLDTDHVNLNDRKTAEFMAWQRDRYDFDHHMSAVSMLGEGRRRVGLSVHRTTQAGFTPAREQAKMAAIFPELSSAFRLAYRYSAMLQESFWDGWLIGREHEIAFLLDERGRVIRLTDAAARTVSRKDGVDVVQGWLKPLRSEDAVRFEAVIARTIEWTAPRAGAMRVSRANEKPPFVLASYPLPRNVRAIAPAAAAALVVMVDPAAAPVVDQALWRQVFALTAREAEFAAQLLHGHSIESAACVMAISPATAKVHLRNLFGKLGVSRQSDLIRTLSRTRPLSIMR